MNKQDLPYKEVIFRKADELQFSHIFLQLHLIKRRGCLLFISCETMNVEDEVAQIIVAKMKDEYNSNSIFISSKMVDPFSRITEYFLSNPEPQLPALFLIRGITSLKQDERALRIFLQGINLYRDRIGEQALKMILFVDDPMLNTIMFGAADFYVFKTGIFRFTDEAKFHNEAARKPEETPENELRLASLLQLFNTGQDGLSDSAKANLSLEIGSLYYCLSNLTDALRYYEIALPLYRKIEDMQNEAAVIGNIGAVYQTMGELEQALRYHQQALEISKQIGYLQGQANALGGIGLVYQDMGELEQALRYLQQALEIDIQIGYLQGQAADLGNIGAVYQTMGELEQALRFHQQALEIAKQIGYLQGQAIVLGNIGAVYQTMGELEQALRYLQQALEIAKQIGYLQGQAAALDNIGLVYQSMGESEQADKYFTQARGISENHG